MLERKDIEYGEGLSAAQAHQLFKTVTSMEEPISEAAGLNDAIGIIATSELLDRHVQDALGRLAIVIRERLHEAEAERATLFHLLHKAAGCGEPTDDDPDGQ